MLAGLAVVASTVCSWAFNDLAGTAQVVTGAASGAITLAVMTILVLGTWHPPGSGGGDGAAPAATGAPFPALVSGHPSGAPLRLAPFGPRVVAALIDSAVVFGPGLLAIAILVITTDEGGYPAPVWAILITLLIVLSILSFAANRCMLQGESGQSVGKMVLKLRLVGLSDGQPVGVLVAMLRDVLHVIDSTIFNIGFVRPLWNERRQTIADTIVRSVVVTEA